MTESVLTKTSVNEESRPYLVGIELREFADGTTMATTPTGQVFHVEMTPTDLEQLLRLCDGTRTQGDLVGSTGAAAEDVAEILELLLDDGALDQSPVSHLTWARYAAAPLSPGSLPVTSLLVTGDSELVQLFVELNLGGRFREILVVDRVRLQALTEPELKDTAILVLQKCMDRELLLAVNDLADRCRVRWSQFHLDQARGWLGPTVTPGASADYRDVLGRRVAAAEYGQVFEAQTSWPVLARNPLPPRTELTWMLSMLVSDLEKAVVGARVRTLGNELEANPETMETVLHPILPLPHRQLDGSLPLNNFRFGRDLVLDERTGLVTHLQLLEHHPSIPHSLRTVQSHIADMGRLYIWANNTVCSGSTFHDEAASRGAALGEGLERYCGNWIQSGILRQSSYHDLVTSGEHAIDPEDLILYSDRQYSAPGFPFVKFDRDLVTHWVRGFSATRGRVAWVPASIVYVNWYKGEFSDDPHTNFLYYPGLAAGETMANAVASGLQEVIERHATMVWWTNAQALSAVELTPDLRALWEGAPDALGQRAWVIPLDNELGVPVMAGVVENVPEGLINIGFGCHPDPLQAARKAWTEALTLQDGSRDLLIENGLYREAIAAGFLDGSSLKPYRSDRMYLDDYRADFHDVNDLMCQQQIFLDPRAREAIRPWVDVSVGRTFADVPRLQDHSLETLRAAVEGKGYEVVYVDVTTPDLVPTGYRVARVVVPGLVPNFPAAFPFLGQGRIQQAALDLGWRREMTDEDRLNTYPMPHA